MNSKKDQLLKKNEQGVTLYDLTDEEILEIASLIALVEQAEHARNFIYTRIAQGVADRLEISNKEISFNFQEIMEQGAKVAKLVVKNYS